MTFSFFPSSPPSLLSSQQGRQTDRQHPESVTPVSLERCVPIPKESASCRSWASLGLMQLQTKRWE